MFRTADLMYAIPFHRATIYLLGILLGYVLQTCKDYRLSDVSVYVCVCVCTEFRFNFACDFVRSEENGNMMHNNICWFSINIYFLVA